MCLSYYVKFSVFLTLSIRTSDTFLFVSAIVCVVELSKR